MPTEELAAGMTRAQVRRRVAMLMFGVMLLSLGGTCGAPFELVNERDRPITIVAEALTDEHPVSEAVIQPGDTYETWFSSFLTPNERWIVTDEDGVVLLEAIVGWDYVEYYDSRIVIR
jgi:hypothetical protein